MRKVLSYMTMLAILSTFVGINAFAETKFDPPQVTANGQYQIEANWSELKRGWSVLVLRIINQDHQAISGGKVEVAYNMVSMDMNPPDKPIVDKGDGTFEKQVFLGMKGGWKFDISIDDKSNADSLSHQINL